MTKKTFLILISINSVENIFAIKIPKTGKLNLENKSNYFQKFTNNMFRIIDYNDMTSF